MNKRSYTLIIDTIDRSMHTVVVIHCSQLYKKLSFVVGVLDA